MTHLNVQKKSPYKILIILLMMVVLVTACQATSSEPNASETMMSDEDMTGMDMEVDDDHDAAMRQFVPNDGAEVHIAAPANEASFNSSDTVPVSIETVDFTVGEDGNHWHIYIDGEPIMVMGGYTYVLQNLSPGQHDIEVYLSNGRHEDLEEGDKVTIVVEE